jgi:RNA polymerase-binding transcription factor
MNHRDSMQALRHRLVERRKTLLRQMSQTEDELRVLDADVPAELEEDAQEAGLAGVLASLDDRGKAEIEAVDRVLGLIDAGDYGICDDCGEEIPVARLEALPTATTCVTCAEAREAAIRNANRNGHRATYRVSTLWESDDRADEEPEWRIAVGRR